MCESHFYDPLRDGNWFSPMNDGGLIDIGPLHLGRRDQYPAFFEGLCSTQW